MLLVQKSISWKLDLRGDKCRGSFNKFNTFVKAFTSSACVGEYSKQGAQLKDIRAFGRHYLTKGQPS